MLSFLVLSLPLLSSHHSCILAGLRSAPLVFNDFPCHTPPRYPYPRASSVISPPTAECLMRAACPWNALSQAGEVSACRASRARRSMCLGASLSSDNGTFIPGLAQLAVSLPLSVLVGLWFKVTLPGLGRCFLSHATREVSVSEVDCTQTGQLVTGLCWITSIAAQRPR